MSIRENVVAAKVLIENGMYESALTLLCIAVAASAAKMFPRDKMPDDKAFALFLGGRLARITTDDDGALDENSLGKFDLQGTPQSGLGYIIYKHYRCTTVHEGELPDYAMIAPPRPDGVWGFSYRTGGGDNMTIDLGLLIQAVENARCNAAEFGRRHFDLVPMDGIETKDFKADMAKKFGISEGRIDFLIRAAKRISPERIKSSTDEELRARYLELRLGAVDALAPFGIVNRDGTLQDPGIQILRGIAANFQLVEADV